MDVRSRPSKYLETRPGSILCAELLYPEQFAQSCQDIRGVRILYKERFHLDSRCRTVAENG